MFKPVRIVATVIFLGSIGLVFVGAFVIKSDVCPLPLSTFDLSLKCSSSVRRDFSSARIDPMHQ